MTPPPPLRTPEFETETLSVSYTPLSALEQPALVNQAVKLSQPKMNRLNVDLTLNELHQDEAAERVTKQQQQNLVARVEPPMELSVAHTIEFKNVNLMPTDGEIELVSAENLVTDESITSAQKLNQMRQQFGDFERPVEAQRQTVFHLARVDSQRGDAESVHSFFVAPSQTQEIVIVEETNKLEMSMRQVYPYYNFLSFLSACLSFEISETTGQKFLILGLFERHKKVYNGNMVSGC